MAGGLQANEAAALAAGGAGRRRHPPRPERAACAPLPAARHMLLCCFPCLAPPGLSPPSPSLRRGSRCPASTRPPARSRGGVARPAAPSSPGPQPGWAGAEPAAVLQCEPPWPPEVSMCLFPIFFFFPSPFFLFFFFSLEQIFLQFALGGGVGVVSELHKPGYALCEELHLVLHCKPKLDELGKAWLEQPLQRAGQGGKANTYREVASPVRLEQDRPADPVGGRRSKTES
ncbi:uncharacterized protein ACIB01_014936 isoform 2-T2 [Guaruba guarouba]